MLIQYRNLIFNMGTPQPAPPIVPPAGGGGSHSPLEREPQIDPRYRGLRKAWPDSILSESFVGIPIAIMLAPGEEYAPAQLDRALPRRAHKHLALVPPLPQRIAGPSVEACKAGVGTFSVRMSISPSSVLDASVVARPSICFHARPATISPQHFELGLPSAAELVVGGAGGPLHALGLAPAVLARAERAQRVVRLDRVSKIDRIRKTPRK